MRPLEAAILAVAALYPIGAVAARRVRGVHLLPLLAVALTVVHLFVERYRWQMVPAYLTVAVMARIGWRLLRRPAPGLRIGRTKQSKAGLVALLPVAGAALLPAAFPIPRLPEPSGPYPVGTLSIHLIDEERSELFGSEPGGPRELMVQFWYPADPDPGAATGPWTQDLEQIGPANAARMGFPSFVLDHLALADTHSYPDAPLSLAQERYPVVVYSHGWTGFRTVNVDQSEALASNGYIVVSIDHTYASIMTVFPDGRAIGVDQTALPDEQTVDEATYQQASRTLVDVYAGDLQFVLDALEEIEEEDERFGGRLDLNRIGLFGHSTGGGAVAATCSADDRCAAGAGLDAWVEPVAEEIIEDGLTQPFLFVRSEEWTGYDNDAVLVDLHSHARNDSYLAAIEGTAHWDFVVIPLLSPFAPQLGLKGPLESNRVLEITDGLLVEFFDAYLKDRPSADPASFAAGFTEVEMEERAG